MRQQILVRQTAVHDEATFQRLAGGGVAEARVGHRDLDDLHAGIRGAHFDGAVVEQFEHERTDATERVAGGTVKDAVLHIDPLRLAVDDQRAGARVGVGVIAPLALAEVLRSLLELQVHRDDGVLDDLVLAAGQVEGGLVHVVGVQLERLTAQRGHLRVVGRPDGERTHRQSEDVRVGVAEDVAVLVHDARGHVGVRVRGPEGQSAQSAGVLGRVGDVGVRHDSAVDDGVLVAARPGAGASDEQQGRESGQILEHGQLLAA